MGTGRKQGEVFRRYLWLYEMIASRGPVSFQEISRTWESATINEDKAGLPHKTFENHREAIETLFDVKIVCDRASNQYYVDNDGNALSREAVSLLDNALFLNNIASKAGLRERISVETAPNASQYMRNIINAIEEKRKLSLLYRHNYDRNREETVSVTPIGLKMFRQRWYLIAEKPDGEPYSYPFDRIVRLSVGDKTVPSSFDISDLFHNCYGIIREPGTEPEEVLLKIQSEEANYIEALPLHRSQQVIEKDDGYTLFSLTVCPTHDFIMELLSHGDKLEVLAPQSLRNEIKGIIFNMHKLYK